MSPYVITPVSYTHLDVYKRQAQKIRRKLWVSGKTILQENEDTTLDVMDYTLVLHFLKGHFTIRRTTIRWIDLLTSAGRSRGKLSERRCTKLCDSPLIPWQPQTCNNRDFNICCLPRDRARRDNPTFFLRSERKLHWPRSTKQIPNYFSE